MKEEKNLYNLPCVQIRGGALGKHNLCTAKLGIPLKSNADTPLPATHIHTLGSASTPQLAGTRASTPRPPRRRAGPSPRRPLATAARHGRWVNSPRRAAPPGHDSELLAPRTPSQRRAAGTAPRRLRPRLRARQRCCRPGAAPKPARLCSAAAGAPSSPPPPPPRRAAATTPPLVFLSFCHSIELKFLVKSWICA